MINQRATHCIIVSTALFIFSLLFVIPVSAQQFKQLDTLDKLDGYRRNNLFTYYLHINQHYPAEIEKIKRWVAAKGNATEKKQMESFFEMPAYDSLPNANEVKIKAIAKYLDWGKENGNPYFLAGFYYYISDLYKKSGQYNKSMENSLYSLDELKKDPSGMYYEQGWLLYQMALDFYKYKDYKKAQELSIAAFKFYDRPTNPNSNWFVKG